MGYQRLSTDSWSSTWAQAANDALIEESKADWVPAASNGVVIFTTSTTIVMNEFYQNATYYLVDAAVDEAPIPRYD